MVPNHYTSQRVVLGGHILHNHAANVALYIILYKLNLHYECYYTVSTFNETLQNIGS
jgi:hypothetical protein